ncbi:MAG: tetratricopeptide repeat protein [Bacteroidaceae bacterium]|nr:tetratricopeptide repeat protein [Bacteroidaceae bacterium]
MTEQEWIRQGKAAYARQDWKTCLDSYAEAIRLNPASEAVELRRMAMSIIEFYCKDRFNP